MEAVLERSNITFRKLRSDVRLSLKTQELTAIFTAVRLGCSCYMEGDIHTVLDSLTLLFTLWVIYMIRFKLRASYMAELDTTPLYYVVVPCALLSIFVHPYTKHPLITRILWAFCVYLESISVLPQLRLMQKAKLIEPFTAHYVFALGISRFLGCAHWVISVYETAGTYLFLFGSGLFWLPTVLLSEVVQTFILADFCYYYMRSVVNGQLLVSLSNGTCKYGTRVDYIMASQDLYYKFVPETYSVISSKGTSDHHLVKVDIVTAADRRPKKLKQKVSRIASSCSCNGMWKID
ncbi:ER lumen protein retaining receptor [Heracleum sosnowskyi]|uniref:ER lumen protein retaining receptor n=1 Tax=Heracleum sosnowskyi TaxID=360622 RepID=A0AAD8GMM0_9APIA|nr:ER lumen protein retaining receptor [Heracleum sosnowskyi]KAK1392151.1 ER lumen protein retaining receptor [Heracleum sosnowskyi]KAK1394195.1 ER lumen protein retaining receptor [Heracleum sosnowskyi]